jgi:hypothetical protein
VLRPFVVREIPIEAISLPGAGHELPSAPKNAPFIRSPPGDQLSFVRLAR